MKYQLKEERELNRFPRLPAKLWVSLLVACVMLWYHWN